MAAVGRQNTAATNPRPQSSPKYFSIGGQSITVADDSIDLSPAPLRHQHSFLSFHVESKVRIHLAAKRALRNDLTNLQREPRPPKHYDIAARLTYNHPYLST